MGKLIFILFQAALINNFVLIRFLGVSTLIGFAGPLEAAVGMGLAVTVVMVLASISTWLVNTLILVPLGASFLQMLFFMILIVILVQVLAMYIENKRPSLQKQIGIYVPLMVTNCLVLGGVVLNIQNQLNINGVLMKKDVQLN